MFAVCKFNASTPEATWLLCSIFILYPFGACFSGWTADQWGRRNTLLYSFYLTLACGILQACATEWWVLFLARLLMGFFIPGLTNIPMVSWVEVAGWDTREEGLLLLLALFSGGAAYDFLLAGIFAALSETYAYELICAVALVPLLAGVVFAHLTEEGPRWLGVAKTMGETDQALREFGYRPTENPHLITPIVSTSF